MFLVGTDDGFAVLGAQAPRQPAGRRMHAATRGQGGIWALSDGKDLWFHPDDGDGEVIASLGEGRANCVAVSDDVVLVGASEARLFRLDGESLVEVDSFLDAPGRERWGTPWGGPPDVRSITIGDVVMVNVHVGGALISSDLVEWQPTADISADFHEIVAAGDGVVYGASAIGFGVWNGAEWHFESEGLHGTYCRAVAVGDGFQLVSVSRGSSGRDAAVYRRHDGTFTKCRDGLPEWFDDNVNTFCLAAQGSEAVIATTDGAVYHSADAGETWSAALGGLTSAYCVLAI